MAPFIVYYNYDNYYTTVAYKRTAKMLALERKSKYSITLTWMRCMLSFALLRCAVTAIRIL